MVRYVVLTQCNKPTMCFGGLIGVVLHRIWVMRPPGVRAGAQPCDVLVVWLAS